MGRPSRETLTVESKYSSRVSVWSFYMTSPRCLRARRTPQPTPHFTHTGLVLNESEYRERRKKTFCTDSSLKESETSFETKKTVFVSMLRVKLGQFGLPRERRSHCAREELGKCAKTRRSLASGRRGDPAGPTVQPPHRETQPRGAESSNTANTTQQNTNQSRQHIRFHSCAASVQPLVSRPQRFLTRSEWSFDTSVPPTRLSAENKTGYNLKHTDE